MKEANDMYGSVIRERVKESYLLGAPKVKIAKDLGISRSCVYNFLRAELGTKRISKTQDNEQAKSEESFIAPLKSVTKILILQTNRKGINELKKSEEELWLCVNAMQGKIDLLQWMMGFLQLESLGHSISINKLESQSIFLPQIMQLKFEMERQRVEFNEKLNHQNTILELKQITELIHRKNNETTIYNNSFLNLRPFEVNS